MKKKKRVDITKVDVLVIGGGSAGLSSAFTARGLGKTVILIEKDKLGGECPNYACVPTKAMITSAKAYYSAKYEFETYGVSIKDISFNFSRAMKYKDAVVDTITGNGRRLGVILKKSGIEKMKGSAKFIDLNTVKVGAKMIIAKRIIIATGVVDSTPPIEGIDKVPYLNYKKVVSLKRQPKSVAIIGGGPVGIEFTSFFSMIGTKVHLFEIGQNILKHEDEEISLFVQSEMRKKKVGLHMNAKVLSVRKRGGKIELIFQENAEKRKRLIVDKIIVAAGKKPNIQGLELEKAGIKLDQRGWIISNKKLQTSKKHIFIAGDLSNGMQLTNTAHRDGEVAGWNVSVVNKNMKMIDDRVVPRVTFGYQEIASVGITAKEAKIKKIKIAVRTFPIGVLGRSVTENRRKGLLKIVLEKKTGKILGAQIVGEHAGEIIHELALMMHLKIPFHRAQNMLHAFPTYSEVISAV